MQVCLSCESNLSFYRACFIILSSVDFVCTNITEGIVSNNLDYAVVDFLRFMCMIFQESFSPSRPESAGDEQTSYTNSMLAHRARYSGRRGVGDPGR